MTWTDRLGFRPSVAIVLFLGVGLPLGLIGLFALGVHALVTPIHFAILRYEGVSCAPAGHGADYLEFDLKERDGDAQLDTVQLQGASNASISEFGWLAPPLGFSSGESRPSAEQLAKAFSGARYPRPLPERTSILVIKLAPTDKSQLLSADGIEMLIDDGEPAYYQDLDFHLHASNGKCAVTKVVADGGDVENSGDPLSYANGMPLATRQLFAGVERIP